MSAAVAPTTRAGRVRRLVARRHSPFLVVGALLVGGIAVVGVLAPLIAPYDPKTIAGESLAAPSGDHLLGTNHLGQDIFSQLVWGARRSLVVAVGAAALAAVLAVVVGVTAGLVGGMADAVAMRSVDVLLSLPSLPLVILLAALLGPTPGAVIVVIGILSWPIEARLLRAQALSVRQRGFVQEARGFGATRTYLIRRHLVPAVGPVIASGFIGVAGLAVFLESGLAFLGLGDPTGVSWGGVINQALAHPGLYYTSVWTWWVLPAGLAVTVAVVGLTFLGVGLETRFNPRIARSS